MGLDEERCSERRKKKEKERQERQTRILGAAVSENHGTGATALLNRRLFPIESRD